AAQRAHDLVPRAVPEAGSAEDHARLRGAHRRHPAARRVREGRQGGEDHGARRRHVAVHGEARQRDLQSGQAPAGGETRMSMTETPPTLTADVAPELAPSPPAPLGPPRTNPWRERLVAFAFGVPGIAVLVGFW